MMTAGRVSAIAFVALCLGFLGGAWFFGSGMAFQFIPPPASLGPPAAPRKAPDARPKVPRSRMVRLPRTGDLNRGESGLGLPGERTDLMPAPGCSWVIAPRPFRLGGLGAVWDRIDPERALGGASALDVTDGGLLHVLFQSAKPAVPAIELRPVFFDIHGNRHVPEGGTFSATISAEGSFLISRFHLDPVRALVPEHIADFGIELVGLALDWRLAAAAQESAREQGIEILPVPVIGQPYPFDLAAPDGRFLRATDFRGKAVLIVVWGSGARGSVALFATKKIRETNRPDALAIIGVAFDDSVEYARQTFAGTGANGPLAVIPNDALHRRLWRDGAGLVGFEQFYLLDREGILRFVGNNPFETEDRVDSLFGRATRPSVPVPASDGMPDPNAGVPAPTGAPKTPAGPPPGA